MDRTEFRKQMNETEFKGIMDEESVCLGLEKWREITEAQVDKNGVVGTIIIAIEEMSELTKELTKFVRMSQLDGSANYPDPIGLIEEMADVDICMSELDILFREKLKLFGDDTLSIGKARNIKLRRLMEDEDGNKTTTAD